MASPPEVADVVLGLARSRPPSLGDARLVCVDGPAGSGKTTVAEALVTAASGGVLVHMDDLYEGWDGLRRITAQLDDVLVPLSDGQAGSYRRWDWHRSSWAETVTVPVSPLLVLEGVGSFALRHAELITVAVWVEVDHDCGCRGDSSGTVWPPRRTGVSGRSTSRSTSSPSRPGSARTCSSTAPAGGPGRAAVGPLGSMFHR